MIFLVALLFLVTSVALSVMVFIDIGQDSQDDVAQTTSTEESLQNELNEREDMLQGTNLQGYEPVNAVNELQTIDLVEGEGDVVSEGATVTAHYTGAYANSGEIFQSSKDIGEPIPFGLDQVIAGWTEGVPGMKVGGTRRLIIPAEKAYGVAPDGYVNGSTDSPLGPLVFDIELVAVEQ